MARKNIFRRPVHVGTRVWADNEEGAKAIAVVPLLQGEVLDRIAIDALGVTRTAETNVDQPPIFSWYGGFIPFPLGTSTAGGSGLSTAAFDGRLSDLIAEGSGNYLGGEPNPGGDLGFLGADDMNMGGVVNFKRNVLGDPMPVALDGLGNADARFVDRFRTVIKSSFQAKSSGYWVFGGRSWRMDAQTDFGAAEVDNSTSLSNVVANYRVAVGDPKAYELFHGGDNYIEADSFKETARRQYSIIRPAIIMNPRIGQPGVQN